MAHQVLEEYNSLTTAQTTNVTMHKQDATNMLKLLNRYGTYKWWLLSTAKAVRFISKFQIMADDLICNEKHYLHSINSVNGNFQVYTHVCGRQFADFNTSLTWCWGCLAACVFVNVVGVESGRPTRMYEGVVDGNRRLMRKMRRSELTTALYQPMMMMMMMMISRRDVKMLIKELKDLKSLKRQSLLVVRHQQLRLMTGFSQSQLLYHSLTQPCLAQLNPSVMYGLTVLCLVRGWTLCCASGMAPCFSMVECLKLAIVKSRCRISIRWTCTKWTNGKQ